MSGDYQDFEALTLNHILLLKSNSLLQPGLFHKTDTYIKCRWKQVQYLADLFWKRWTKEYLTLLQERQKWTKANPDLQKGDIVMIVNSSASHGSWPLGKVVEVLADAKRLVRIVKVKTKTGVLERPITKLCLLLENDETLIEKLGSLPTLIGQT